VAISQSWSNVATNHAQLRRWLSLPAKEWHLHLLGKCMYLHTCMKLCSTLIMYNSSYNLLKQTHALIPSQLSDI
jgi:hypothetical protein